MTTATELNNHLANGGYVQLTTYTASTIYSKKHAGFFETNAKGNITVRHGKSKNCISIKDVFLVGVRLYDKNKKPVK